MFSPSTIKLGVVNYKASNMGSILSVLSDTGIEFTVLEDASSILKFNGPLIIPGVGAYGAAMDYLESNSISNAIKKAVQNTSILGICLGMQIFADVGTENGTRAGLGLLKGEVVKLEKVKGERVPNIGWRKVLVNQGFDLDGFNDCYFYFCHSYFFQPFEPTQVVAYFKRGDALVPAIICDTSRRIWGIQFHPEKSGTVGLRLISQLVSMLQREGDTNFG